MQAQISWNEGVNKVQEARWQAKKAQHQAELARIPYEEGSLVTIKRLSIMAYTSAFVAAALLVLLLVQGASLDLQQRVVLGIADAVLWIMTVFAFRNLMRERTRSIKLYAEWQVKLVAAQLATEKYEAMR